ncbi:MAG: pyridoxal-phosphate dependent enzyme, partial [Candidatus Marinimicrobia bacterium]|nr:pyridoxal-phosphate dependent enzyme [Candidatus Neomarinimicrobiota bacterium]
MNTKVPTSSPDNRGAPAWTGYRCLACGRTEPSNYPGYGCAACGRHLELTYDFQQVRGQLDPGRAGTGARADIFRYLPWLPLPDARHAPTPRVGQTPLYAVPQLADATPGLGDVNLFLKDDGLNPSASFKDRAGAVVLARARQLDVPMIAGASTGNAGSSLACLTAGGTPPCVIFVPAAAPVAKLPQLLIFGARVVAAEGSYDQPYALCAQICAQRGWYNRNTG